MNAQNTAALFSFLRVLAVALASAVLPFVTAPHSDDVPVRAVVYAVASAFLLTVINYLRPGEPRFGLHAREECTCDDPTHAHDRGALDPGLAAAVFVGVLGALVLFWLIFDVLPAR